MSSSLSPPQGRIGALLAAPSRPDVAAATARIAEVEPGLGAVVARCRGQSEGREDAPLSGLLLGVKDLIAVAGEPRACGAPELVDLRPQPVDATAVAALRAAGATVFARLALHPLAFGVTGRATRNPAAPDRLAGGSSSGSAAAVAVGIVHAALGTDTGGSVRIPAACCGVAGLKPTRGRIALDGVAPLAPSLDTLGPIAADAAGCGVLSAVLDPAAFGLAAPADRAVLRDLAEQLARTPLAGLRIGVPREVRRARLDPDVRAAWEALLARAEVAGARVTEVSLPALPSAPAANGTLLGFEAAAVHAASAPRWRATLPDEVAVRLERGRDLAPGQAHAARRVGAELAGQAHAAFAHVDVLCTPTLPCRVPAVGAVTVEVDGVAEPVVTALTRLTNPWNLSGLPAGTVPIGRDGGPHGGAPIGVQLVGARDDEAGVLAAMAAVGRLAAERPCSPP